MILFVCHPKIFSGVVNWATRRIGLGFITTIIIIIIITTTIVINSLALLCQKKKLSSKQVQYSGKYMFRIDLNLNICVNNGKYCIID